MERQELAEARHREHRLAARVEHGADQRRAGGLVLQGVGEVLLEIPRHDLHARLQEEVVGLRVDARVNTVVPRVRDVQAKDAEEAGRTHLALVGRECRYGYLGLYCFGSPLVSNL